MVFKKKAKEIKQEETATITQKEVKPEVEEPKAKLLIDMTEPERFMQIYSLLANIEIKLNELVEVAKQE